MFIALAKRNPHLRACVLDIEPVCKVAKGLIKGPGLSRRISTFVGDIHKNLPHGYDVIMFCDIGRIQNSLLRTAHQSLPQGGMEEDKNAGAPRIARPTAGPSGFCWLRTIQAGTSTSPYV